jgi:small-conductance mechanosensitive channel
MGGIIRDSGLFEWVQGGIGTAIAMILMLAVLLASIAIANKVVPENKAGQWIIGIMAFAGLLLLTAPIVGSLFETSCDLSSSWC